MTADEYIEQRRKKEEADEATGWAEVAKYYRWWTVSASREHVKLGPIAVAWYRWGVDVVLLCRYPLFRIGGPF